VEKVLLQSHQLLPFISQNRCDSLVQKVAGAATFSMTLMGYLFVDVRIMKPRADQMPCDFIRRIVKSRQNLFARMAFSADIFCMTFWRSFFTKHGAVFIVIKVH
jgi:hypothetical protein